MHQLPPKVAVIGVGTHGWHHARIYSSLDDVELVAVVDANGERAEKVAKTCGSRAETDYKEVLGKVDAVSVAVPTVHHHRIGLDFLKSGADVLIEKPISKTVLEAEELVEEAEKSGRILMIGHTERFNPATTALQKLSTNPKFIESHRLGAFPERSTDVDVILDVMIHDLDIILHLVDASIKSIDAIGVAVLTPVFDIANARIHFQNGCVANVTASRVSADKIRKVRIFQRDKYVSLDYAKQEVLVCTLEGESGRRCSINRRDIPIEKDEPLKIELSHFLTSVRTRGTPLVTGEDGKAALEVALKIIESIHTNEMPL